MQRSGWSLGRIAGIEVNLNWTLLIVFCLIAGTLALGLFPIWHPGWSSTHCWATAIAAALLFFASILAHELSHAVVGRMDGIAVRRISLFVFGGMAELEEEPRSWRAELRMAIVGPLTSIGLGVFFLFLFSQLTGGLQIDPRKPARALAELGTASTLLLWLGQVNIILALFNLVPAFPLDGGRVLRALIWGFTGNQRRATRLACSAGQAFAWLLIGLGLAMIFGVRVPLFGTGALGGLWLVLIGWFLNNGALMSYRQLVVREALEGVSVARLMRTDFDAVRPDLSLSELVDRHLLRTSERSFPVLENGRLLGIVSLEDVRKVDRSAWNRTTVRDVMTLGEGLAVARPDDDALKVITSVGRHVRQVPVMENGTLRGLLRREDILKWLALYGDSQANLWTTHGSL